VQLTSAEITSAPVQNVSFVDTPTGRVGYMLFNDHILTAENALVDAVNQLNTFGIDDLVRHKPPACLSRHFSSTTSTRSRIP
jgi:hypothetical protein